MKDIKIQGRTIIGEATPVYIIAEMSANHAGSLGRAKEIIRAAKEAGADCIKIQTYTADTITMDCDNEYFQITSGTWKNENLYQLYKKAYTPWEWQRSLKAEAQRVGIDFLSTPFDPTAVDFLEDMEVDFYKIASFELVDIPLIEYVASMGKPVIMSTGMASFEEIKEAVEAVRRTGNEQLVLLRCASAYPAITDEMNLRTMQDMGKVFDVYTGLSDHSMGSVGAVTAAALGAKVIEKHFCLGREIENPDSSFSMEPEEFQKMVSDIRQAEKALGTVKYGSSRQETENLKFRKSIFVVKDIKKGEPVTPENIRVIRPGYGMAPRHYKEILGSRALKDMEAGTPLSKEALGDKVCYLRRARRDDIDTLFEWRNEKTVRENSFSTELVPYETHLAWFQRKSREPGVHIYILCEGEKKLGMLRLECSEAEACINYSIAAKYRGQGYGTRIIRLAEQEAKRNLPGIKQLRADVREENIASARIFEKLGYEKKGTSYRKSISIQ